MHRRIGLRASPRGAKDTNTGSLSPSNEPSRALRVNLAYASPRRRQGAAGSSWRRVARALHITLASAFARRAAAPRMHM
eukprot:9146480-Pyramimonas_sp.AAC.1